MAKLMGSKCKMCRREGMKLFLKGSRCDTPKCSFTRDPKPPGQHGAKRVRFTDYTTHLREKQKVKRMYGILEKQFKRYFQQAQHQSGNTGENLLILLERRLDNVVFRGGLATSRVQARQFISHGHIVLNNKRIDIPSSWINAGEVIKPAENETSQNLVKRNREEVDKERIPSWLKLSEDQMELQVVQLPQRGDITAPINEQLIVEFASR